MLIYARDIKKLTIYWFGLFSIHNKILKSCDNVLYPLPETLDSSVLELKWERISAFHLFACFLHNSKAVQKFFLILKTFLKI